MCDTFKTLRHWILRDLLLPTFYERKLCPIFTRSCDSYCSWDSFAILWPKDFYNLTNPSKRFKICKRVWSDALHYINSPIIQPSQLKQTKTPHSNKTTSHIKDPLSRCLLIMIQVMLVWYWAHQQDHQCFFLVIILHGHLGSKLGCVTLMMMHTY